MFGKLLRAMCLLHAFARCGSATQTSQFVRVSNTTQLTYTYKTSRYAKGRFACAGLCKDYCWYLKYEDNGSGSGTCDMYNLWDMADYRLTFVNISNLYKKVQRNESVYIGMRTSYNWQNAQNKCLSIGAKLAIAETASKLNAIIAAAEDPHLWLGARKNESGWFWLSGVAMDTTPAYHRSGDCLYMNAGKQYSDYCASSHYMVCEIQL